MVQKKLGIPKRTYLVYDVSDDGYECAIKTFKDHVLAIEYANKCASPHASKVILYTVSNVEIFK